MIYCGVYLLYMNENKIDKLTLPGAIVVAGIIIALAIIYSNNSRGPVAKVNENDTVEAKNEQQAKNIDNIKPVSPSEHILGNPNAQVKIVEYSDIECPFCKRFHPVMQQIM